MTVLPVATSKPHFGKHELSVTVRNLGDNKPVGDYVTIAQRTIKMWLYLAQCIESSTRVIPDTHNVPIDADKDFVGAETRVTVFNWSYTLPNQIGLTVHSDTFPQQALNVWYALFDTLASFEVAPQTASSAYNSSAQAPTGSQAPATAKGTPQTPIPLGDHGIPGKVSGVPLLTKKDAIATLVAGSPFRMKSVQIEKHSKDGNDYYEFFEPYGGKAGQYSAASVFTDNEVAIKTGFIAYLNSLNVSMKTPLTGEWVLNCVVGKPKTKTVKGEEKTFTNIFVNGMEGMPPVIKVNGSVGEYAYDSDLDGEHDYDMG